ncbi:MAG TPA: isoprenylcysteine carboxylmethyltransferase family protein [Hyphomicrobiaceae bacterium]|nr:isoprenylcysteine carboxylmethyltransferase family protein [Hyphomicrobiaceae bacterium]
MTSLDLKIPPPAVAALIAGAMWGISLVTPSIDAPERTRIVAAVLIALAGGVFSVAGIISFRLARTTVNPMKPETTSCLVRSGIYRFTRNPMYLGLCFLLVAWAIFLACPWALLGVLAFVLYMTRFQIGPEERVLSALFGEEYVAYKSTVRRWL